MQMKYGVKNHETGVKHVIRTPQKGLRGATKKQQKSEKPGKTHHFCKNHPSVQMEKVQNEI